MDIILTLTAEFNLKKWQIENVVSLIDGGNTIPFIARYRKEATGSLDDQLLRELNDRLSYLRSLEEQKETGTNKLVDYNNNLWQKMCGWYHSEYSHNDGPGGPGYAATLTCPTKETLLNKNYDLTGCEVVK